MIVHPVFKHHSVRQQGLFPLNLNDLISENHSARLIVVERLEILDIGQTFLKNISNNTCENPCKFVIALLVRYRSRPMEVESYLRTLFLCDSSPDIKSACPV
jgi:hypothetical protein